MSCSALFCVLPANDATNVVGKVIVTGCPSVCDARDLEKSLDFNTMVRETFHYRGADRVLFVKAQADDFVIKPEDRDATILVPFILVNPHYKEAKTPRNAAIEVLKASETLTPEQKVSAVNMMGLAYEVCEMFREREKYTEKGKFYPCN